MLPAVAWLLIALCGSPTPLQAADSTEAPALYAQHCATCHGPDRLGAMGPALLPENLERLKRGEAVKVITRGRPATQMPAFGGKLTEAQIKALADYVYTPPAQPPRWGMDEMRKTHVVYHAPGTLPDKPVFKADPLNLFVVVEAGDHHVTILDGDRLEPIQRFPSHYALHGGPKFSPDGRYVYFASRDGWITRYDLYNLKVTAEIRAGINTRNLAVSGDGRWVMVGNYLPHTLVVLKSVDLSPVKLIPVEDGPFDKKGGKTSRVSAVYDAPPRGSFIAALKDIPEVWEIPYSDKALPVYKGIMHDYRAESGETPPVDKGPFPIRRIVLQDYLDDFFFDPGYQNLIGASRGGAKGQVVNLIVGRKIADVDLPGLPHLGSGITWEYQGRPVLATPNLKEPVVTVIDMKDWKVVKRIPTLGPGFFMRSHESTPYAWVDVFSGPDKDAMQVIDKRTLEIVKTLRPVPGKTSGHTEFTRDGRYVLVSIWEMDGAIVVYDAASFREVKRIPMKKPVGKYNVYNKITHSAGTSH